MMRSAGLLSLLLPLLPLPSASAPPTEWSVACDENIAWTLTLPETGQSAPRVAEGRVFFTTYAPVEEDSELGKDIEAWCVSADDGELIWKKPITGRRLLRLSGCFGDSTSPPAVVHDGRVIFLNASGTIACFDLDGNELWKKDELSVARTQPFISADGHYVFTRQVYPPSEKGSFPHSYKDAPLEQWTQLQALDPTTGEVAWTSHCGINMGNVIYPARLNDGSEVVVVGRGGGHGPPEKPDGISMLSTADGSELWSIELDGFASTQSYGVRDDEVHFFHGNEHLTADAKTGEITQRISMNQGVSVFSQSFEESIPQPQTTDIPKGKKPITQGSNRLVGHFHYFRSYTQGCIGRVNVESAEVEYLQVPVGFRPSLIDADSFMLEFSLTTKDLQKIGTPNTMRNSRGFVVNGDKRSVHNGWGHTAAPPATVSGDHLYIPVQGGLVYVIDHAAEKFTPEAIVSINDLGEPGDAYTRAAVTLRDGRAYAHTIQQLICIETAAD